MNRTTYPLFLALLLVCCATACSSTAMVTPQPLQTGEIYASGGIDGLGRAHGRMEVGLDRGLGVSMIGGLSMADSELAPVEVEEAQSEIEYALIGLGISYGKDFMLAEEKVTLKLSGDFSASSGVQQHNTLDSLPSPQSVDVMRMTGRVLLSGPLLGHLIGENPRLMKRSRYALYLGPELGLEERFHRRYKQDSRCTGQPDQLSLLESCTETPDFARRETTTTLVSMSAIVGLQYWVIPDTVALHSEVSARFSHLFLMDHRQDAYSTLPGDLFQAAIGVTIHIDPIF